MRGGDGGTLAVDFPLFTVASVLFDAVLVAGVDLEPAMCDDPQCDADHGYSGVLASDDFSIRASATADGTDAVAGLLAFAESLSARTQGA